MNFCNTPNGARVAYTFQPSEASRPKPLVLLHGFCEDSSVWQPLLKYLKTDGLLQIDMPGFGQSELPAKPDMADYAAAVLAVLEAEKIAQCALVGHSMGGYVALEFAARWPERLAGLGLFHSQPYVDSEEKKTARRRGIETLQSGKRDLYVTQLFPNLFAPEFLKTNPDVLNALIANGKKQSATGIAAALQAMISRRDHQSTLTGMGCPVLFLLGEHDTLVPPAQALQATLLPLVVDVHLLPDVAHMAMWEATEESAAILNAFWALCLD